MPFLNFDNAQIFYEVAGQGQAFVMLHAGIAHSAMWALQFERFQKNYRVVRYDQRGFGKTVTATKAFNRRADLLALLDHLDIARAILMGCSMGGSLALEHGADQGPGVAALLVARGFRHVRCAPDLAGHDRVTSAQWPQSQAGPP